MHSPPSRRERKGGAENFKLGHDRKNRTVARVRSLDYNKSRFKTFERFLISETSWMADQLSGEARGTSSEGAQEFLKDVSQDRFLWLNRKVTSMRLVAFA